MASDLLLLNNSSSRIGSALYIPRIASMQNLIPRMALTYAQLISPIQYPDLPELLPLEKYHHIYDSRSLLAKNFGDIDILFHENVSPQFLLVYFPQPLHNTLDKINDFVFLLLYNGYLPAMENEYLLQRLLKHFFYPHKHHSRSFAACIL